MVSINMNGINENVTVKEKNKFPCMGVNTINGNRQLIVMFFTDKVGIVIRDDCKLYRKGIIRDDWCSCTFKYMSKNTSSTITVTNE